MTTLLDFLQVLTCSWRAFRLARAASRDGRTGSAYSALTDQHGVPQVACFVAVGRDAWRVSQRAVEEFEVREGTR